MNIRSRISLEGPWKFSTSDANGEFETIHVPAPWQADARFRNHISTAWYVREFGVPPEWLDEGSVIVLGFGAVDYRAEVWVNETSVGEHEGGYLPFEFDITAAVQKGANHLRVRVDDPLEIFAEIPHGKQSWYGLLSGIWQPVWLESRPTHHIQRVKISTYVENVQVQVFTSDDRMDEELTAQVIAPDGKTVAQADLRDSRVSIPVEHPLLWSPDEPNLYILRVSTGNDEVNETFGFRTIETRDGKILLNGKPFYLRGALDQDYYPEGIYTPPSQDYIEDEFRKTKEMGLNCLRVHIKVADPRYYAAADKIGLLIWTELPNHALLSEKAKQRARQTIAGMVERDGNHPSIGIWTIINESWGINLTDSAQRAWLADTYHWLKELDPTRLVVGNSACWGNFHVVTDIADFHIYYAMPDHHEQWREWVENYARRPSWLFAHEYRGHKLWREFSRDPWHADDKKAAPEVEQNGEEPLLVSEFGNWGLPNVQKLYEGNAGAPPWWFDTGLEWGDGIVYPRGIEARFHEYHLDRVFTSLSSLTEASQRLQYDALKFEIEQMRRFDSIQGYVITELTDLHWECNGLLDMYRNPKAHYAQLKEINREDLLIPVWERIVFSVGENCTIQVLCSHYSSLDIKDAALEWELIDGDVAISGGWTSVNQCAPFCVTELDSIQFDIPQVEHPVKAQLKLRLLNEEQTIASAEQEVYFFPGLPPLSKANRAIVSTEFRSTLQSLGYSIIDDLSATDLAITTTLDDSFRDFLLRGGKVLFLAEKEDALQTYIPGLGIEKREGTPWQGDWASSFGWHRFSTIPTEGVVNFAFAGLTPEQVLYSFAPREFALDVYAGLFVGWLHKPIPTVARRRVGDGELLISTFRLSENLESNPLAGYLFRELLNLFS